MKFLVYFSVFLYAVLVCSGEGGQNDIDTSTVIVEVNSANNDSTTFSSNVTTDDPNVTASTPAETNSSSLPTTTSASEPSTAAPTQEPNVTTSTTAETNSSSLPTTTSASEPSTAAPTTPKPDVKKHQFIVKGPEYYCIVADLAIALNINVTLTNGTDVVKQYIVENVTTTVDPNLSSNCSHPDKDTTEVMVLNIENAADLGLTFTKKGDSASLTQVTFLSENISLLFEDAKPVSVILEYQGSLFDTTNGMSYLCNSPLEVQLVNGTGNSISFAEVQVEAFRMKNTTDFAAAKDCNADDVSNIVPIAVGCALAGLVVIVLIAYLVGRRQKRQRGYESV